MKTKEELNALKEEVETVNKKLHELTEEELAQVSGGEGAEASTVKGASQLLNKGLVGIDPRSEPVSNPSSLLSNVDTLNRPPTPPSPVAESVKTAVDAALQNW